MSANLPEFNRGVVSPTDCIRGGWNLIKDQYWLFMGMTFVAIFIGGLAPLGVLMGPMMCGLYLTLFRKERGEFITFDMLFKGFDYFIDSFVATLIQLVPVLLIMIPAYIGYFAFFFTTFKPGRRGQPPPTPPDLVPFFIFVAVMVILILAVSLIAATLFIFTYPLIVDRRLSGINAVKTSIKAATANLGGVLGLVLMITLLNFVGLLLCYIGILFVLPLHYASWMMAYRQVFPSATEPTQAPPPPPAGF